MFCLVLFIVFVILKLDPSHGEYDVYFRRGSAVEEVVQNISKNAFKRRSDSGGGKTEIAVIRLRYDYDTNGNFTVWKDEPMKIIIENAYARHVWCVNKYVKPGGPLPEPFVPETEFPNNIVIVLNITKVTAAMSTRWGCTVLQEHYGPSPLYTYKNRNYTAKTLHFRLYVKGARQVILTANNQKVKYDVKTNLSDIYYGVANYTYEDGEDIEFSCRKAQDDTHPSDTVHLEYFNAEGMLLFQSKPRTNMHKFRSVLKVINDKYYLDCICTSIGSVRENRYRTTFYIKKDAEEHSIKLSINGQKLTTVLNNETSIDDYIFRYIDGEILNVTCQEIHWFQKGTIHFIDNEKLTHRMGNKELGIASLKLLVSNVNNKSLSCGINNTKVHKPIARLLFSSDVPDHGVRVRGLPRNNILYQYTNDLDQWTIEYQYSVNDSVSLTCVAKSVVLSPGHRHDLRNSPHFQWTFKGEIIPSTANWKQSVPNIKTSDTITKILYANHNGTKIYCTYFPKGDSDRNINKTVEIILRLKTEQILVVGDEVYTDKDSHFHMIIPIAVSFGVAVAVVTLLCVICWRKRTKRANLIKNAYDNLSNENDSPIPAFPSQWESNYDDSHYTSIDEGVMQENYNYSTDDNSLYKMPYKRASNNSENHYTEIDEYFKPKHDGLTAKWNSTQPTNYKNTSALKATASHNPNNAIYNNSQGTYDKLMHKNLSINKGDENYSNLQTKGKNKSVTFRKMSNDLRPASINKDNSNQDCKNNDQRLKQNNDGQYANTDRDIYMQPEVMQNKPYYENNFLKNKETANTPDYAEPYGDLEIGCKVCKL